MLASGNVTALLLSWCEADGNELEKLILVVYSDLQRIPDVYEIGKGRAHSKLPPCRRATQRAT